MIKSQTNLYQEQIPEPYRLNMKAREPVTVNELRIFLALTINMGHVRKSKLENYWSTDPLLSTPIFNTVMCRNSLVLWKGRLMFKQYLRLKKNRFGIKMFELVDCKSGFLIDFIVYTGSTTDFKKCGLGISGDIVAHFLEPYYHKGHVIYIDNWYSSPQLAEFLHNKDTGMCGTLRKNRKSVSKLNASLNKGQVEVAHNDVWIILKWMDKKEVYMITTVHKLEFSCTVKKDWKAGENIIKPTCILDYNQNMGAVDNIDRRLSLTETTRKSISGKCSRII
ncbi:piggyBac transposable element-derived protein 4-like [Prorops nasuta]|uniref:piggyBac transposable element-derived protein 4-like n=1 Tax=Prorops nasuta TaxID=863751 RepID=UPI0034CE540C